MNRRFFLQMATAVVSGAGVGLNSPSRILSQVGEVPRFVAPPQHETPQITAAIDHIDKLLKSGYATTSSLLSDPAYLALHEWPRFRRSIRENASGVLRMVSAGEAGTRLRFKGSIVDNLGRGTPAIVYLYQTSAKGWYSDKAAHISGNSGDQRHARLFGYVLCDGSGQFEVRTIRPAGYPESSLPAHIHVEISSLNKVSQVIVTEAQFADDPRLTAEARQRSRQDGFVISDVVRTPDGGEEITAVFPTRW